MAIALDGNLADWSSADRLEKAGLGTSGHEIYGRFEDGKFLFAIKAPEAIGAGTTFWLNTDRDATTGKLVFGSTVGADYYINFNSGGLPELYDGLTDALVGSVTFARSADGTVLEFELAPGQLGGTVGAITFTGDINDTTHLTADYAAGGFTVNDPSVNPLDGLLTEWTRLDRIDTAANAQSGYEVYGKAADGAFQLALKSALTISSQTTFWLNTDQNTATGTQVFGNPTGSDFRIEVDAGGVARLYTGAGSMPLATLNSMLGPDQKTLEITLPKSLVGNTDRLDIYLDVNQTAYLPGDYAAAPPLTLVDTSESQHPDSNMQKIAIVYSETTAANFFSTMAYSQLFMAAQSQAMAAGIPFDVISEADLTDLGRLSQYDALVFPSFRNVPTNYEAIAQTLTRLVYDYDVSLITAGDFMTNDAAGNAMPTPAWISYSGFTEPAARPARSRSLPPPMATR
jgi:serralysin